MGKAHGWMDPNGSPVIRLCFERMCEGKVTRRRGVRPRMNGTAWGWEKEAVIRPIHTFFTHPLLNFCFFFVLFTVFGQKKESKSVVSCF